MGEKKKPEEVVELDNVPVFAECPSGEHTHFAGYVSGVLHQPDVESEGETVYEAKSFVGGGNPTYSKNYDEINWN